MRSEILKKDNMHIYSIPSFKISNSVLQFIIEKLCCEAICSPDTHKDSANWIGKRRGKEEIEVF